MLRLLSASDKGHSVEWRGRELGLSDSEETDGGLGRQGERCD